MQRREFIAAVGAAAASAVSQSSPIYAQPIGAVAHRTPPRAYPFVFLTALADREKRIAGSPSLC